MTTGIIHYLLQWWNYKVEGTLPFKCLNLSVFRHVEDAVLETSSPSLPTQNNNKKPTTTTTNPKKMRHYGVKGKLLPMLTTLEADFFLSLPPSKIVFGCDPS